MDAIQAIHAIKGGMSKASLPKASRTHTGPIKVKVNAVRPSSRVIKTSNSSRSHASSRVFKGSSSSIRSRTNSLNGNPNGKRFGNPQLPLISATEMRAMTVSQKGRRRIHQNVSQSAGPSPTTHPPVAPRRAVGPQKVVIETTTTSTTRPWPRPAACGCPNA